MHMSIKVTIAGINLENCIDSVHMKVDTSDDSSARTTEIGNTIVIVGRIDVEFEPTVGLYQWSLVKPTSSNQADVYKKVEVEITSKEMLLRKVVFPEAFVVDYSESYSKVEGVGTFEIYLKQKKDNKQEVEVSGE